VDSELLALLEAPPAEARPKLEALITSRRSTHGPTDLRYAHALEASAEVLFRLGESARALDRISEAGGVYFKNKHPRFADAIALEAELVLADSSLGVRPFDKIATIPEKVIEAVAAAVLERSRKLEASRAMELLRALYAFLLERAGESHPASVRVLAGIANLALELGLHSERRALLDSLVASFECINALPQAVEALIQRGITEERLGEVAAARATFDEAIARAKELAIPELISRAEDLRLRIG
jgi:tetratricopeptide (TPR) repeat protein